MQSKRTVLLHFLIGSSFPVFFLFFLSVQQLDPSKLNYTYKNYTLIAPVYLGLVNALLHTLVVNPGPIGYLLTGFISGLFVFAVAYFNETYDFNAQEWQFYFGKITGFHTLVFFVLVQILERIA